MTEQPEIPIGFEPYSRTPVFTEESIPKALLERHSTKAGVWALIHVKSGSLHYHVHEPLNQSYLLTPAIRGTVRPEVEHHVEPSGAVEFFVEFWRRA